MRPRPLLPLLLFCLLPSAAQSPSLEGAWLGTLDAGGVKLRIQLNLKASGAGYTGTMDSLDQGALGIPVSSVSVEGDGLKLQVEKVKGSYQGKIAGDRITGQWTQGERTLPLDFNRSAGAPPAPAKGEPLTAGERRFLIEHLERTRKLVLEAIAGLSETQWNFKPAAGRWSIAECAEHIVLAEGMLRTFVQKRVLLIPPAPGRAVHTREIDEQVLAGSLDRTNKAQAMEAMLPAGKFATPAEAAKAFQAARALTIEYARTTADDLRYHATPNPRIGHMDGYQYLLLIAGHSERHKIQIDEVKSSAAFPAL